MVPDWLSNNGKMIKDFGSQFESINLLYLNLKNMAFRTPGLSRPFCKRWTIGFHFIRGLKFHLAVIADENNSVARINIWRTKVALFDAHFCGEIEKTRRARNVHNVVDDVKGKRTTAGLRVWRKRSLYWHPNNFLLEMEIFTNTYYTLKEYYLFYLKIIKKYIWF